LPEAEQFLAKGCQGRPPGRSYAALQVVKTALLAAETNPIAEDLSTDGPCVGLAADLADAEGPQRLAAQLARHEPQLNILINNAGANETGSIDTASIEDWDKVMNVNLRAGFFLIQQLLPRLRAAATAHDPARIINIGSIWAVPPPVFSAARSRPCFCTTTRRASTRISDDPRPAATASAFARVVPFSRGIRSH
jgi:NAD(P)-dependent dehydrogenase (short-subunit alcohol dehydrogenase family)